MKKLTRAQLERLRRKHGGGVCFGMMKIGPHGYKAPQAGDQAVPIGLSITGISHQHTRHGAGFGHRGA